MKHCATRIYTTKFVFTLFKLYCITWLKFVGTFTRHHSIKNPVNLFTKEGNIIFNELNKYIKMLNENNPVPAVNQPDNPMPPAPLPSLGELTE